MIDQSVKEQSTEKIQAMPITHLPVMSKEVIELLDPKVNGVYVDGTLGLGGHSEIILNHIGPEGRVIGIDHDQHSLAIAKDHLKSYTTQCEFIHDSFSNINKVLDRLDIKKVDGILLDLGISSFQLDNCERGFSIRMDGPLDMRMNQDGHISAFDLINSLSQKEISMILKDYGQERWHQRIARGIVVHRSMEPIQTTNELSKIILKSIPYRKKREKIHPATRTFQAIRIAVNRELETIEIALEKCVELLKTGGRIVVISFHSLEDRIVKNEFRTFSKIDQVQLLTKKPLRPSEEEVAQNPRARSARLRAVEKK